MPEPDIVVTRWRGEGAVPLNSIVLIIEVADTTLDRDLSRTLDLYAVAGVPEYWVIGLHEGRALMHAFPDTDRYDGQLDILLDEILVSATIEGLEVEGSQLLR